MSPNFGDVPNWGQEAELSDPQVSFQPERLKEEVIMKAIKSDGP